ncbi:MAG: HAMP domain-containing sensor histidine kinase [Hydrogenophaga sp.]|nr:HAMP domain-containing sensor histidine kinase [Hydrogenophaga sp.]
MSPDPTGWVQRTRQALRCSLKLRLVLVFIVLALAMAGTFIVGAQKAFSVGWREAARPLLMDYTTRLAAEVAGSNGPPSVERALAITQRLPLTVHISGPAVNWSSHPRQERDGWQRDRRDRQHWADEPEWTALLQRATADGHRIEFGLNDALFERRPRMFAFTLGALLVLTLLAYLYVRRLLRPLEDIRAGALRFGAGEFGQPIPVRCENGPDELGQLAVTINTMGQDIHQMLEAKRSLLLAISHELRSPLTRARLNTELLPEQPDTQPQREALLRDLQEMAALISDLLESERLASRHAALLREPVPLRELAQEVIQELMPRHPNAAPPTLLVDAGLPVLQLDSARIRLLLRNLLDNALRHSGDAAQPVELHLRCTAAAGEEGPGVEICVRDHGPGVPEEQLAHLAEPFYRADSARTRSAGGVGLGLHLCQLVATAHGGGFSVRNVHPGLAVTVTLPGHVAA